ncbi:MAG: hypothetical protein P4L33_18030 [Capsulimonadaceae bacterium]|nr:hypothetical protein [Capsulimonadaceae bacterium]
MTLSAAATVSLYIVLVFVVIFALLTVALLAIIAFSLRTIQEKLGEGLVQVKPVLDKTTDTLDTVQRVTNRIGEKADTILERGEELTNNVSRRVEETAAVVEKTVSTPLIKFSSVVAGVAEGISSLNRHFGDPHSNASTEKGTNSNGRK